MFTRIMEERVQAGDSLWDQCLEELRQVNPTGKSVPIQEVERLVRLASHQIQGDFRRILREITYDSVNGFMDNLPF